MFVTMALPRQLTVTSMLFGFVTQIGMTAQWFCQSLVCGLLPTRLIPRVA